MIKSITGILIGAIIWLGLSWLLYNSAHYTFNNGQDGTEIFRGLFIHGMVSNAVLFFFVLYLFPRNEGRFSWRFFRQLLSLFVAVTGIELVVDSLVLNSMGASVGSSVLLETRVVTLSANLLVLGLGLFTGLAFDWFYQHRIALEIREKQARTELGLLKSRIHPHFLFNALNGIFYLAQKKGDEETADAIARLSQMMRYMLHEVSEEQVALEGELDYLENYIALQRMRLNEAIPIDFTIEGKPGNISLPPMILLPFVENAFKHGVSNARPTPISIRIHIKDSTLELYVENSIHPCVDQESGGFGLENAHRRLELLFPGRYQLEEVEKDGKYRVRLTLVMGGSAMLEKGSLILKERST